jgi:hypothetical protein
MQPTMKFAQRGQLGLQCTNSLSRPLQICSKDFANGINDRYVAAAATEAAGRILSDGPSVAAAAGSAACATRA